jgi:transposase
VDSMTSAGRRVVVGVDAHTDTHDACVLDDCGRLLGTRTFTADAAGYRQLLGWARRFGSISALGVESTDSYAAGLTRYLRTEGLELARSTSRTRTHGADAARATRSTPSSPRVTSSPTTGS